MNEHDLRNLLSRVSGGGCSVEEAVDALRHWPAEQLSCAHLDHHRDLRTGFPEVVYGESKTAEQIVTIMNSLMTHASPALATRVSVEKAKLVMGQVDGLVYNEQARMLIGNVLGKQDEGEGAGIVILSAGTSDIPVAEEAFITAQSLGNRVAKVYDVGVAGIHRLLSQRELMQAANVLVVVAGMEGALPSVIGGLVAKPVIAVPTSVGYGTGFGGIAALLGMLNSCAPGVAVVNIDNGFGAGCVASAINRGK